MDGQPNFGQGKTWQQKKVRLRNLTLKKTPPLNLFSPQHQRVGHTSSDNHPFICQESREIHFVWTLLVHLWLLFTWIKGWEEEARKARSCKIGTYFCPIASLSSVLLAWADLASSVLNCPASGLGPAKRVDMNANCPQNSLRQVHMQFSLLSSGICLQYFSFCWIASHNSREVVLGSG